MVMSSPAAASGIDVPIAFNASESSPAGQAIQEQPVERHSSPASFVSHAALLSFSHPSIVVAAYVYSQLLVAQQPASNLSRSQLI
jgi:hypothetical protein